MKQFKMSKNFVIVVLFSLLFISCSKVSEQTKLIPADVAIVGVVDVPSIGLKGKLYDSKSFATIDQLITMIESSDEATGFLLRSLLKGDKNVGVSLMSPMYFYTVVEDDLRNANAAIVVALSDEDDFANNLESGLSDDFTKETLPEYTYYTNENGIYIAFNDESAVFLASSNTYNTAKGVEFLQNIFALEDEESIASNETFKTFVKDAKDVSILISGTNILSKLSENLYENVKKSAESHVGLNVDDFNNSYATFNLALEDENISVDATVIPSDNLAAFIKDNSYYKSDFEENLLEFLPKATHTTLSFAVAPEKLQSKLQDFREYAQIEAMLAQQGISADDFFAAIGGDVAFSLYDITVEKVKSIGYTYDLNPATNQYEVMEEEVVKEQIIPKGSVALSLNDEKFFTDLFAKAAVMGVLEKVGNNYKLPPLASDFPVYLGLSETTLILSSDEDALKQLEDGGYSESFSDSDLASNVSPEGYYFINLDYASYPEGVKEFVKEAGVEKILETYGIFKSLEVSGQGNSATVKLNMLSDDENSLYQILQAVDNSMAPQF